MERRPHMLTEHKVQVCCARFDKSLAADPAADKMDQGVNCAEFRSDRPCCAAKRIPVAQIDHGGEETLLWQVQLTRQCIQFVLIVIEQDQGMTAPGKGVRGFASQCSSGTGDDDCLIHL